MVDQARKISLGTLLVAVVCFFLPFMNVSCQGQRVVSFTGIQLVTGTIVKEPQPFGPPKERKLRSEPLAVVALAFAGLAAVLALLKNRAAAIVPAAVSAAGAVFDLPALGVPIAKWDSEAGEGDLK